MIDGDYAPSTYRFMGEEFDCDCATQVMLRKHYVLADIPEQYMRLDWDRDFIGEQNVNDIVHMYLDKWPSMRRGGMGLEFGGTQLGVGKTFAATHIGKELVKRRVPVRFTPFYNFIHQLDGFSMDDELVDVEVLILDEVTPPITARATALFQNRFEDLIRARTNSNRPTIMTTNMSEEDLRNTYARTYSLLAAKQIRVEMMGGDARQGFMQQINLEIVMNDEVRPIS